jgi:hypothetical protein
VRKENLSWLSQMGKNLFYTGAGKCEKSLSRPVVKGLSHPQILNGLPIPVRIRVRIDRVSCKATKWGGPSDETRKTEAPCHSKCGTIKIPRRSKALSAEHRPKF